LTNIYAEARFLIPMDGRRVIRDGAVYSEDGRIVAVGKREEVKAQAASPEHVIRLERGIILPGLINTHVHLAQALIRGVVPDNIELIEWLRDWVWPLQGVYDEEDGRASAELCIAEMLRTGTTTFLEVHVHKRYGFDGIAEAVKNSGIRGFLSKSVMDQPGYATQQGIMHPGMIEGPESLQHFKEYYRRWDGEAEGRIRVWIGLRTPGACSDELFLESARLANELDTGITMHLAEVRADIDYFKSRGTTPTGFLERFNLLGRKRVYIHCVWLSREDMRRMAAAGSSVAHCPSSNLKLGSGLAPVAEMREEGVNVALGTDGGPSNDTYDMIREMKLASILQKGRTLNPKSMGAWDVLEMATVEGAKALGIDKEVGMIKPGMKADFITISLDRVGLHPISDPVSLLVYAASGLDVRDVVIDGRIIVKDAVLQTLNEEEVMRKARERLEKVLEKDGRLEEVKSRWQR